MPNNGTVAYVLHLPDCDVCGTIGITKQACYDAVTPSGRWANLCAGCFKAMRCRLGVGLGQRLEVKA